MVDGDEDRKWIFWTNNRERKVKRGSTTLAQLWWANSEQMDVVTEKLADGSSRS